MSQIELTLTAEQVTDVARRHKIFQRDSTITCGLHNYLNYYPLTLTFEMPSPWNYDISKAPKDCTEIFSNINGFYVTICWYESDNYWADEHGNTYEDSQITAWMEIPALPERI